MAAPLADKISAQAAIPIPTIGISIGAPAKRDGQILVMKDMPGLTPRVPKFVMVGKAARAIERAI